MLLAYAFLEQFSQQQNKKIKRFSPEAVAAIENYPWRGNVRELESKVKRAIILADSNVITTRDLGLAAAQDEAPLNLREVRERAEKEAILKTLNGCKHNLTQAAKLLGVTRPTLYNLLSRYGIEADN